MMKELDLRNDETDTHLSSVFPSMISAVHIPYNTPHTLRKNQGKIDANQIYKYFNGACIGRNEIKLEWDHGMVYYRDHFSFGILAVTK